MKAGMSSTTSLGSMCCGGSGPTGRMGGPGSGVSETLTSIGFPPPPAHLPPDVAEAIGAGRQALEHRPAALGASRPFGRTADADARVGHRNAGGIRDGDGKSY